MTGRPRLGLALAGTTALISGVSVFVNSYAVHSLKTPAVYTTAKNLVALVFLGLVTFAVPAFRRRPAAERTGTRAISRPATLALFAYVGVIGGGVAFILFFNGLASTSAVPAAFVHDTLVVWVALLAPTVLGERLTWWNVGAIVLLLVGATSLTGGIGHLGAGQGLWLVLVATVLWAAEVIAARWLLASWSPADLSLVRMGVGVAVLLFYLGATGHLGALISLDATQQGWVLLTGLLLAGYVATWMAALSMSPAVDVTSVLVAGAFVTAVLQAGAGQKSLVPELGGLVLVAAGTALAARAWPEAKVA